MNDWKIQLHVYVRCIENADIEERADDSVKMLHTQICTCSSKFADTEKELVIA
jgi:hypothetical protein